MGEKPPGDSGEHGQRDRAGGLPQSSIRGHCIRRTWRRVSRRGSECFFDLESARLRCVATDASDPFPDTGGSDAVHSLAYPQEDANSPVAFRARSRAFQPSSAGQTARRQSAVRRAPRQTTRCRSGGPRLRLAPVQDSYTRESP